jgi:hypothetical protein
MNPDHIDALDVSRSVRNALLREGITSITEILRIGSNRLTLVRQLGKKSIEQICVALERQGYTLTEKGVNPLPPLSGDAFSVITLLNLGDSVLVRQGLASLIETLGARNLQPHDLFELARELKSR